MFGRKRTPTIQATKLTSLLADNLCITGTVEFAGGLRVDGHVQGDVIGAPEGGSLLVLSDKGSITGRVRVYDAVINGRIEGDLEVDHFVELQAKAHVTGNISYRQLQLDCGATVEGRLTRTTGNVAPAALPAPTAEPAQADAPLPSAGTARRA